MGKRKEWILEKYRTATCCMVTQYYKKCSAAKIDADNRIRYEMVLNNGTRYRICSGNHSTFQSAYCYKKDGSWILKYFTKSNTEEYLLTKEEVDALHL